MQIPLIYNVDVDVWSLQIKYRYMILTIATTVLLALEAVVKASGVIECG